MSWQEIEGGKDVDCVVRLVQQIKHKRKKVKMAITKYYKVEADGKIKRLRRECPVRPNILP